MISSKALAPSRSSGDRVARERRRWCGLSTVGRDLVPRRSTGAVFRPADQLSDADRDGGT
jgi:hypothetical protein